MSADTFPSSAWCVHAPGMLYAQDCPQESWHFFGSVEDSPQPTRVGGGLRFCRLVFCGGGLPCLCMFLVGSASQLYFPPCCMLQVYWLVGSCPCKQAHICRFMQCSNSLLLIACATLYSTAEVWCRELPRVTLMNNCDHNTMPGSRWDVHVRGKKLTLQESIVGDGPPESACLQQFRSVVHFSELQDPKLMPKILESLGPCA